MELSQLNGIGEVRLRALKDRGIDSVEKLLKTLPVSYRDMDRVTPLAQLSPGQETCVEGVVEETPRVQYIGRMSIVRARLTDGEAGVQLTWFNQPWMGKHIKKGQSLKLFGRVQSLKGRLNMTNPEKTERGGIQPRYPAIPGVPRKTLEGLIAQALPMLPGAVEEVLSERLMQKHGLLDRRAAFLEAHRPTGWAALAQAQRRIGFEELFLFQMAVRSAGGARRAGRVFKAGQAALRRFQAALPFTLTDAQRRVLDDVVQDMAGGRCMNRLVQGDVGSGKTAVALAAAFLAAENGCQSALMAPTEVLARQHYLTAQKLLAPLGVTCGLLVGGMKAKERRAALSAIETGEWQLAIGTHALISEGVRYHDLGLVMTDEQHRFGVRQRKLLSDKGEGALPPHTMVLSATPIPRTLALILYGDLDVSTINALPPGRTPVETRIVPESKRGQLYRYVAEAAARGEQAYFVCPLVEESGESEAKSAVEAFEQLRRGPFASLRLGLTYGTQKPDEKEDTLRRFAEGGIDVLVATTVIEVGIDVPNATLMVIENADRFGLSQLHQLRGRVGRGQKQSWCFLLGEANERLKTLCDTNDGFAIAQKDLDLRGPGEFLGTRQHGRVAPDGYGVNDIALVEETRAAVDELLADGALAGERRAAERVAREKYLFAIENVAMN